jgi:tRNA threonylcarbamoyl adenosine modification protein YeaZ
MELALDTSTEWAGIGLSQEGNVLSELTWRPGKNHTTELFPNLDNMLASAGVDMKSLSAIFVAKGPGSYNGLRAGISAAKGLAFSLAIPIVGINTLEIEAYPFAFAGLPICPLYDAGRGEIAAALYSPVGGWKCLEEAHLTTTEILCQEIRTKTIFCGEVPEAAIGIITSSMGSKAIIPGFESRLRRPAYLARLGWPRLQAGQADNLASLQPIYLRQPPITQRKKKY